MARHRKPKAAPGPTLVGFVADVWAPKARRRLASKTWERDQVVYRKHIRPRLGDRRIASLDIEDLVIWQEELEEAGVGEPTIAKAIGLLSSVAGLTTTRPYDLGRHTHSALMLASGMSLQRLARIQGHGIRVLDETYSEQLAEFEEREGRSIRWKRSKPPADLSRSRYRQSCL